MSRLSLLVLSLAAACSAPSAGTTGDTIPDAAGAAASVARLESDARALAKLTGCTSADQCRTAPVGSRPCGGPRAYFAYCAASTDSVALFRKLDELKTAEDKANAASGMGSTCEFRMPPVVALEGGSCRAP